MIRFSVKLIVQNRNVSIVSQGRGLWFATGHLRMQLDMSLLSDLLQKASWNDLGPPFTEAFGRSAVGAPKPGKLTSNSCLGCRRLLRLEGVQGLWASGPSTVASARKQLKAALSL